MQSGTVVPILASNWEPGQQIGLRDCFDAPDGIGRVAVVVAVLSPFSLAVWSKRHGHVPVSTSLVTPPPEGPAAVAPPVPVPAVSRSSARRARPEGKGPAARPPRPAAPAGSVEGLFSAAASGAPVVTGWDGSVPRQAAEWHRTSSGVRVVLRPGFLYEDGSVEKIHPTVRLAKDLTRAARRE